MDFAWILHFPPTSWTAGKAARYIFVIPNGARNLSGSSRIENRREIPHFVRNDKKKERFFAACKGRRGCGKKIWNLFRQERRFRFSRSPRNIGSRRTIDPGPAMLLKVEDNLPLNAPIEQVWSLLRDTSRLAGLLPGVESVARMNEDGKEAYAAKVSDRIGPFKITMNLEVRVTESAEPSLLKASIKGADSMGLNRMTGSLQVALSEAVPSGTQMHFEASIEVLGKLATLGAVPIRRRTTQVFAEFARNIQGQFAPGGAGTASNV
jgi:carbon monoxide dehydrogenase subunit G